MSYKGTMINLEQRQINWFAVHKHQTGNNLSEIVRMLLDYYISVDVSTPVVADKPAGETFQELIPD